MEAQKKSSIAIDAPKIGMKEGKRGVDKCQEQVHFHCPISRVGGLA